jgi:hypothetical protein
MLRVTQHRMASRVEVSFTCRDVLRLRSYVCKVLSVSQRIHWTLLS